MNVLHSGMCCCMHVHVCISELTILDSKNKLTTIPPLSRVLGIKIYNSCEYITLANLVILLNLPNLCDKNHCYIIMKQMTMKTNDNEIRNCVDEQLL